MSLFDYKTFLVERKKSDAEFIVSDGLKHIINRIGKEFYMDLMSVKSSSMTFIDIGKTNDTISFLQSTKLFDVEKKNMDPWKTTIRQELKVGRFFNRLLSDKYTQKDIEDIVNKYKAGYEYESFVPYFDIVEGTDVSNYYNCDKYVTKAGSPLYNSCMKFSDCSKFMKFFDENPQSIKMLVLRNKDNKEKIDGRANLWFLEKPEGRIFMDRIYVNHDYMTNVFINYAKENGLLYKSRQVYGGSVVPIVDGEKSEKMVLTTKMKPIDYEYYPYVDTLQFYNRKTGEITSDSTKWDLTQSKGDWIGLLHAGGSFLSMDHDNGFKMDYIGRLVHPSFVRWSKIDNCYIHRNDAVYLDYKDDYCIPERDLVEIGGKNYLKEDTYFDNEDKIYKTKK